MKNIFLFLFLFSSTLISFAQTDEEPNLKRLLSAVNEDIDIADYKKLSEKSKVFLKNHSTTYCNCYEAPINGKESYHGMHLKFAMDSYNLLIKESANETKDIKKINFYNSMIQNSMEKVGSSFGSCMKEAAPSSEEKDALKDDFNKLFPIYKKSEFAILLGKFNLIAILNNCEDSEFDVKTKHEVASWLSSSLEQRTIKKQREREMTK